MFLKYWNCMGRPDRDPELLFPVLSFNRLHNQLIKSRSCNMSEQLCAHPGSASAPRPLRSEHFQKLESPTHLPCETRLHPFFYTVGIADTSVLPPGIKQY